MSLASTQLPGGNNNYNLEIVTVTKSESKATNESTVYAVLQLRRKAGNGFWSFNTQKVSLTVGGRVFSADNKGYDFRNGETTKTLLTATQTFKHNANGTGSVAVSGTFTAHANDISNGAIGSGSTSGTHLLTTFNRTATLSSVPATRVIGAAYSVKLSNVSSGLTYRLDVMTSSNVVLYSRSLTGDATVTETNTEVHSVLNTLNGGSSVIYKLTTLSGTTVVGTSTKTGYVQPPAISIVSTNRHIVLGSTESIRADLTGISVIGGISITSTLWIGSSLLWTNSGSFGVFDVSSTSFIENCMYSTTNPYIKFTVKTSAGTVIAESTLEFTWSVKDMTLTATVVPSINTVMFGIHAQGGVTSSLRYEYSLNNGEYIETVPSARLNQIHSAAVQTLRFRVKQLPYDVWYYSPVYDYVHTPVAKGFSTAFPEYIVGDSARILFTPSAGVTVEFTPVGKPMVSSTNGIAIIPLTEDYTTTDPVVVKVSAVSKDDYGSYSHGEVLSFTVKPEEFVKAFKDGQWVKVEALAYNRPLLGTYTAKIITLSVEDTNLSTGQLFYGSRSLRPAEPFPANTVVYMECEFEHIIAAGNPRDTDFLELRIGGSNMIIHNIPYGQKSKFSGIISTDSTGGIPLVIYGFNRHTPAIGFSDIKVHTATGTFLPVTFSKYEGSSWKDQ